MSLLDTLFGSPTLGPIFSDRGRLDGMLRFEAALAAAEAKIGVIPAAAAAAIAAQCRAELYDMATLSAATAAAGNPLIPLVKQLTALVAQADAEAARFVHWGATSQDAMDTGLVLQLSQAVDVLDADLARLAAALAALAAAHRLTPMIGRTWLQHALPVTFGLKAAGWLDAVERHRRRLAALRPQLLVLQFGGAAGTLAALGDRGLAVSAALAEELGLALPDLPWHAERDRLADLACLAGMIAGTLGKLARDVSLMMQTDVGEAFEPAGHGRGGSSTMPHKRNPVTCAAVLAAAARAPGLVATMLAAMPQEHERGLGGWHAEWTVLPELLVLTGSALAQTADMMAGLELDTARMRANIDATRGLVMAEAVTMALGHRLGRLATHERVEAACKRAVAEQRHLREVLAQDATIANLLSVAELDRLFDPINYIGSAAALVDRVLAARG
jgi:3-carboxy-cis,cis-muconate cycloisomerase